MKKPVSALYRVGGTEPRPSSLVHLVDQDCSVVAETGKPSMLKNKKTGKLYALPAPDAAGLSWLKAYDAEVAAKMAKFGDSVDSPHVFPCQASEPLNFGFKAFACYMITPGAAPVSNDESILYYWIGIEDNVPFLLQPVLQAINSQSWTMQSYFVDGSSIVMESAKSGVLTAGTVVQPVITNNGGSSFTSQFNQYPSGAVYPATPLTVERVFTGPAAVVAFEAFGPVTDYFPASFLFQWVALTASSGANPTPAWSVIESPGSSTMAVTVPASPNGPPTFPWRRNITVTNTP
jgi:hypothetical protein